MSSNLLMGIYLESDKRFEFDFARHLLKISIYQDQHPTGTIVSPFRVIKGDGGMYLLIHNYDRTGDRKIVIESMDKNELIINHENTSYTLKKVA